MSAAKGPPSALQAAYEAESLHHDDSKIAMSIDAAVKASQLRKDQRDQLRNDLASLRIGLRDALLWDYPQHDGAAACPRVAEVIGATCVVVAGAPFLFTDAKTIARPRPPRFCVLDAPQGPRWADEGETAEYQAKLHHAATIVQTAAVTNAIDAPVGGALTGLAPPALWGWLLDYPCVYCFADGDRAQHALDDSVLFELCAASLDVRGPRCGVPLRLCEDAFTATLAAHVNELAQRRPQLFGEISWFRSEPPRGSTVAL